MKKYHKGWRRELEGFLEKHLGALDVTAFDKGATVMTEAIGEDRFGLVTEGLVLGVAEVVRAGKRFPEVWSAHGRGHWLGLEALMDGSRLGYRALMPSKVAFVDFAWFRDTAPRELLLAILADEADLSLEHRERLISYRSTLKSRVMVCLLHLRSVSDIPEISITQSDLASMAGASRSNIVPILKEFEDMGVLERSYRNYLIAPDHVLVKAFSDLEGINVDGIDLEGREA